MFQFPSAEPETENPFNLFNLRARLPSPALRAGAQSVCARSHFRCACGVVIAATHWFGIGFRLQATRPNDALSTEFRRDSSPAHVHHINFYMAHQINKTRFRQHWFSSGILHFILFGLRPVLVAAGAISSHFSCGLANGEEIEMFRVEGNEKLMEKKLISRKPIPRCCPLLRSAL